MWGTFCLLTFSYQKTFGLVAQSSIENNLSGQLLFLSYENSHAPTFKPIHDILHFASRTDSPWRPGTEWLVLLLDFMEGWKKSVELLTDT